MTWDTTGTGNWFDVSNWLDVNGTHSLPLCVSPTYINNGGTADISTTHQTAYACLFVLGLGSAQSGSLAVEHGTLHACSSMTVGAQGKGAVKITNSDSLVWNTSLATIGEQWGSSGTVSVDGGGKWHVDLGTGIWVGGTRTSAGGVGLVSVTNGGSVEAVSVYVWKSGTLTGNGTVSTTSGTTVDGTLAPSGGTFTLSGDISLHGGAATEYNFSPSSLGSKLEISGSATVNGRLSVTIGAGTPTGRYTLLHSSNLSGFFSSYSIKVPGCLAWNIVYDYDHGYVYLDLSTTC